MIPHLGVKTVRLPRQLRMASASANTSVTAANAKREKPVRVLLTNDDGPESPFFHKFAKSLRRTLQWNTFVCIPDSNWSYVSKSVSKTKSFDVDFKAKDEAHAPISPASCVNLGLYQLCQDCDLVVSGPNIGHNLGRSAILSSGTVGAALEGCIHGRKAMAVSFPFKGWGSWTEEDIDSAVKVATDVAASLWENWDDKQDGPAGSVFYNVNVPLWACKEAEDKGGKIKWVDTGIDDTVGYTSLFQRKDKREEEGEGEGEVAEEGSYVWQPGGERVFDSESVKEGGDVAAVKDGHVSISKLTPTFQAAPQANK